MMGQGLGRLAPIPQAAGGLHEGWVLALRFAPDGSALYSISHDGKLGVLVPAERLLQAPQPPPDVRRVCTAQGATRSF